MPEWTATACIYALCLAVVAITVFAPVELKLPKSEPEVIVQLQSSECW